MTAQSNFLANGVVFRGKVNITGRKLEHSWPGTFVLVKISLEQTLNLNLHSLMAEFREAALKELETAQAEESSNKLRIGIEHYFGRYAENKEAAIAHRNRYILPALEKGSLLVVDFQNVQSAPHSFLSALLATPIKRLGMNAYKRIQIVNAAPEIRETIDFILNENTASS